MAEELADQTPEIDSGVQPADITPPSEPVSAPEKTAAPEKTEPPKKLSLRDQINNSVEEVRKAERNRDQKTGQFAPEPKTKAAPEKAAPEVPKPQNAQPEAPKPLGPPSSWSKEAKAVWDALPDAAKAAAVKREEEVSKGFDEYRGKTAQLQEISQALEPLRPMLQQQGIATEAQAVKRLLEWEGMFRNPQTRIGAFHQLARQYGVNLSTLVQNPSEPSTAQGAPAQPSVDLSGITQKVNNLESELQRRDRETVSVKLSEFAKDKPHFEKVRVSMGKLMQAGLASPDDLEGAYQKAISLDPEVSAAITAEKAAKDKAEQDRLAAEKAAKARLASVSPSVRAPSGPVVNGSKEKKPGVRGSILASIAELQAGQRA